MISRTQLEACIAEGLSRSALCARLHISARRLRQDAKVLGVQLPAKASGCRNGHPRSARRMVGNRECCGACYDANHDARAAWRRKKTRDWVSGPKKGAPQEHEKPLPAALVDAILEQAVRNETLPVYLRRQLVAP